MDISISFCCPTLYHCLYHLFTGDRSVRPKPICKGRASQAWRRRWGNNCKKPNVSTAALWMDWLFVLYCLGYLRDNLASSKSNVLIIVGLCRLHGGCESLVWVALKDTAHSSDLSVEGNRLANSAGSSAGDGGSRHIEKCLKLKILYGVINLIGVFLVESKFKS